MGLGHLQIHDLVLVRIPDEETPLHHRSRIQELGEGELTISWPFMHGQPVPISPGAHLYLLYQRARGTYGFDCMVRKAELEPVPCLELLPLADPRILRDREDVRVVSEVPAVLVPKVIPFARKGESPGRVETVRARTVTLSAGGFSIHHPRAIPLGTVFEVQLQLPESPNPLRLKARVVRCARRRARGGRIYNEVALAYAALPEAARAEIARHVFRTEVSHPH